MKIDGTNTGSVCAMLNTQAAERVKEASEKNVPESDGEKKRDKYVQGEADKPIGLYSIEQDEDGGRAVRYDAPEKSEKADEPEKNDEQKKTEDEKSDKSEKSEKCTADTDKVDREIKRLREKEKALAQRLRGTSDEEKARELERELAKVKNELTVKDNDSYRRSHTVFS